MLGFQNLNLVEHKHAVHRNTQCDVEAFPEAALASSQHGTWVTEESPPREPGENCPTFYDLLETHLPYNVPA